MMRRLLTAGLVLAMPVCALAQDKSILNDKDDVEFAKALAANNYPDLAERLLNVVEKSGKAGDQAKAQIAAIKLDLAQDAAAKIEDPIKRKDALVKTLADKEKFVEEFKGKDAAEDIRNALPDLYNLIGETIAAAIKKEKDPKVLDALRAEGDALFLKAEQVMKNRIADLKAMTDRTEADENKYQNASYNYPRTMYFHSLLFPQGSAKRIELCNAALTEFGEFELEFVGGDNSSFLGYYMYIDVGLCLKETGAPDEALKSFEKTIVLRESWGAKTDKGVWPIPPNAREIVDLVCYGLLQKAIVLRDQKKPEEVVKIGKEYFTSVAKPFGAPSSMLLAKELCEAQIATGDKGAGDTAKMMIKEDENGIGAVWGRELLEKMGGAVGTPYTDKLKTAETKIAANDFDRGIAVCRQVLFDTAGTTDELEAGSSTWLLIGYAYQKRFWFEEAALAFETGVNRFPKGKGAAESLSRAIECYDRANKAARRQYYKDLITALTNRLIRDYPGSVLAGGSQMKKAADLADEKDYLGAIEIYGQIEKTSTDYTKARLLMGICYFNYTLKLAAEKKALEEAKKTDEAAKKAGEIKKAYSDAEAAFKFAMDVTANHPQTMDPKVLAAYDEQQYLATISLAKLYMLEGFGRAADASPVIDQLEAKWGKDGKKGPDIQNLRGKLFLSQGKIDVAEKWVDDLFKRDPKAAAGPAGQLARALDTKGQDTFKGKAESLEGDQFWLRAARFYWISIEPQVSGTTSQNVDEMTDVGNRMYVYGLHFNGVPEPKTPEHRTTFVDWAAGTKRAPDPWVKAARIYEAALAQNPSYRMTINLGRTYGFLAKWVESAGIYAKLFDQEQIVDQKTKNRLDRGVMSAKPELVMAYVEWGTAERMAALGGADKEHLNGAMRIFTLLSNTLKSDTLPNEFWASHYQLVRTLIDRGEYKNAQLSIDDLKRNVSATFDDDKFGYKTLFEAAIEELKKK